MIRMKKNLKLLFPTIYSLTLNLQVALKMTQTSKNYRKQKFSQLNKHYFQIPYLAKPTIEYFIIIEIY
jgi:hypothetical protein